MRAAILPLLCAVLLAAALPAETNGIRPSIEREYNPFLAGTLSWYSAGLGQIYSGEYTKGAVFFAIDTTLLYMTINAIANIDVVVDQNIGLGVNVSLRKDTAIKKYRRNGTFFLVAYLTFHFYNVFDAVLDSTRKNQSLSLRSAGWEIPDCPVRADEQGGGFELAVLSRRF